MSNSWVEHAACRGLEPATFYPASDDEAETAKAICAQCPVSQACLEHAIARRERDGVWGGLTDRERQRLIRRRRRLKARSVA